MRIPTMPTSRRGEDAPSIRANANASRRLLLDDSYSDELLAVGSKPVGQARGQSKGAKAVWWKGWPALKFCINHTQI